MDEVRQITSFQMIYNIMHIKNQSPALLQHIPAGACHITADSKKLPDAGSVVMKYCMSLSIKDMSFFFFFTSISANTWGTIPNGNFYWVRANRSGNGKNGKTRTLNTGCFNVFF